MQFGHQKCSRQCPYYGGGSNMEVKILWIPVMLRLNDLSLKYRELEVSVRRRSTTCIYLFSCLFSYYFFKFISLSRINHRNKIAFTFINFLVFARERNNLFFIFVPTLICFIQLIGQLFKVEYHKRQNIMCSKTHFGSIMHLQSL